MHFLRFGRLPFRHNQIYPRQKLFSAFRTNSFHTSCPLRVPLVPLPALLSVLQTGKLVSYVSMSSRASLTLLPTVIRREGKMAKTVAKAMTAVPLIGVILLIAVGLDQAPNTSRLRLLYLNETEEKTMIDAALAEVLESQKAMTDENNTEMIKWLQEIVDDLAAVAVDDIRDSVRHYSKEADSKSKYDVHFIQDGATLNAFCIGTNIVVFDLMVEVSQYNEHRIAAILSHEIAHSLQRHFVEKMGFAALLHLLGDITRALVWKTTEYLGPYMNEHINDSVNAYIDLESERGYNRQLEKEADLIGLKIMAKAGYDPQFAVEFWKDMVDIEKSAAEIMVEQKKNTDDEIWEDLYNGWFGSTHPPSEERVQYIKDNLKEATEIYKKSIKLNGHPKAVIEGERKRQMTIEEESKALEMKEEDDRKAIKIKDTQEDEK